MALRPEAINDYIRSWLGRSWLGDQDNSPSIRAIKNLTGESRRPYPHEDITPYAFRRTFAQRLLDAKVPLEVVQSLMGHDDIGTTQLYAAPNDMAKIEALEALDKLQTAVINETGEVILLDIPVFAGHEEITSSMIGWGGCAEKGRVRFGGNICKFKANCHNCFFLRSRPLDLPHLHLEERELAMQMELRAGVDVPSGPLANDDTRSAELKRRRINQFIDAHEGQIDADLSPAEQERVFAMLSDQEEVVREILEPLSESSPAARISTDDDLFHPYAAQERDIDLTEPRNETPPQARVSFHSRSGI